MWFQPLLSDNARDISCVVFQKFPLGRSHTACQEGCIFHYCSTKIDFRLDGLGCSCLELFYEIFELGKPGWVVLQAGMGLRMV